MKRILSLLLALVIVLSSVPIIGAPSEKEEYNQAGEILKNLGVLKGSKSGDLMLDQYLKRQEMVVLISRLYNKEGTAENFKVKNTFTDVDKDSYYAPFIYWAVDEGLIKGTAPGNFGYTIEGNKEYYTKVQQLQNVLLRALKYGSEIESYDDVPELAESLGLMEGLSVDPDEHITRGLMAAMTLNALNLNVKGSSDTLAKQLSLNIPVAISVEATSSTYKDTLIFEGVAKGTDELKLNLEPVSDDISSGEQFHDIELKDDGRFEIEIKNLEGGKYKYSFLKGNLTLKTGNVTIQDLPFELNDVSADNLKEISLNFTQSVDEDSSQFPSNYYTNAGTVKSVRLENNNKTIILTLNETMKSQNTYKISINRIKSETDEEITIRDREFSPFDNEIPEVIDVEQLGNKGLKIIMSEPIKTARISNFKIDGEEVLGQVDKIDNVIMLKYYSSNYAPKEGKHTLSISELTDFADYKALDDEITFEIVKDNQSPKLEDARATTEQVILELDEDIDSDSINRNDFYWRSGHTKRYPSDIEVINNKVILNFSGKELPTYEITIYIDNLEDYSGNELEDEEVEVEPVLDTTAPEVIGLNVSKDGKTITIYYSKNVNAKNRSYYDLRDEDNEKIYIRNVDGSGREYKIYLSNPLPAGTNTITIDDVVDTTTLENTIKTYTQDIYMEDVEIPKIVSYSGHGNEIILRFSKEMDASTISEHSNYLIKFDNDYMYLPSETEFNELYNEKTYIITLPDEINGEEVNIGENDNVEELDVRGLTGINGILIEPEILKFDDTTEGEAVVKSAELTESDTIIATFDQPILDASEDDFKVTDRTVRNVKTDGTEEVEIRLDNDDETTIDGKLTIKSKNSIVTYLESSAKADSIDVIDKVRPRIDSKSGNLSSSGRTIYLPFTEELDDDSASLFERDLIVEAIGEEILDISDYSTTLDTSDTEIRITISKSVDADEYSIRLVDDPKYIMDTGGNVVEYDDYEYFTR
ncbi:S-layer homology domain-containing protein [Schnuerera sp. xch1]|uniref:S-layer homology domain-containing protein n=1 Tax=Schnuerera sp. xch1 TaxID=2874283 RepID=UPI001CC14180|nr:S-layer homology domain-containing protein [Schnuerera sp. xch1]MBZ2174965.1 S-layer homology domain-containing protein [Schnuerera sp. xch1]